MIRSVYSTRSRALVWLVLLPVHVYRMALSPLKRGPSCRYLPTCSEYAITAVKQRGIIVGVVLATWRILRCSPLGAGGYDPVPPRRAHHCQEH
jgi:putative membrane protein insertion efficiency factor